jgi:hypothetical protein
MVGGNCGSSPGRFILDSDPTRGEMVPVDSSTSEQTLPIPSAWSPSPRRAQAALQGYRSIGTAASVIAVRVRRLTLRWARAGNDLSAHLPLAFDAPIAGSTM